jgi:hypothetical protein
MENWRCQFGTSNKDKMGVRYKAMALPNKASPRFNSQSDNIIRSSDLKPDDGYGAVFIIADIDRISIG